MLKKMASTKSVDVLEMQDKMFEHILSEKDRLLKDIKTMSKLKFGENTDEQKFLMNKAQTLFYRIDSKIRDKQNQ